MPPHDPHVGNTTRGTVRGQLIQARDIRNVTLTSTPDAGAPENTVPDVSLDPPLPATAVRGRTRLLEELTTAMGSRASVPHVLTGPGGFGKTTVAAALAERARADGRQVFWVRAGDVATGMLEAAVEMGGARAEAVEVRGSPQRAARWVWQHLDRSPEPWLLVFDNADRPEELDPHHRPGGQVGWLRSSPTGFVLVTSRVDDPALWAPAQVHTVGELGNAAAGAALADHAGEDALPGAEELAERLDGVPLALALAGRILATHRVLFPDARALHKRLNKDGVTHLDTLAEPFVSEERSLLSGVWDVSLDLVADRERAALPLFRMLSILGSEGTPIPLRRLTPEILRKEPLCLDDEVELARVINVLIVQGLVSVHHDEDETTLRIHPLVSESVRSSLKASDFPLADLIEQLIHHHQDRDPFFEQLALHHVMVLHRERLSEVKSCAELQALSHQGLRIFRELTFRSGRQMARFLLFVGEAESAEETITRFWDTFSGTLNDWPGKRVFLGCPWAEARLYQGDIESAEAEYRHLLPQALEHLGPDHPETSDIRFHLALLSSRQEEWDGARERFLQGIQERALIHGAESIEVLRAKENLAIIAMERGHHATASSEFEEVHALRVKLVGEGHPATAQVRYHQAVLAYERGGLARAHTWFTECLRAREHALGRGAPVTEHTRAWVEHTADRTEPAPQGDALTQTPATPGDGA